MESTTTLTTDTGVLQQMLLKTTKENESLKLKLDRLQHQLNSLLRSNYGKKAEPFNSDQAELFATDEAPQQETHTEKETITYKRKKRDYGRRILPDDLPRERIVHDLPDDQKSCGDCNGPLHKVSEEVSEQLESVPAKLYVKQHVRIKYGCRCCEDKIITAPMPAQPIDKGLAGPGLLAEVLVNKYADHLPLYRQSERFKRHKIEIPRSTLCDWVATCAQLLKPITDVMTEDVLKSPKIHTDDVPVPVQAKGHGQTKKGRFWVYIGCGGSSPPAAVYDYTPSRSQQGPVQFLRGYQGYLQADAYPGYDVLFKTGKIIEVGCMAHARRKFYDVAQGNKNSGSAYQALSYIQKLYRIESDARELNAEERRLLRLEKSKPLLNEFKTWLDKQSLRVLPKSPVGGAIHYALNQWQALISYLDEGMLDIDNNRAERAIKPIVIGRKNYMFVGSDAGGENAAGVYSLIQTCKENKVNPYEYLRDVLTRLPTHKMNRIRELLPYNWAQQT